MKAPQGIISAAILIVGTLGGTAGVFSTVEALRFWAPRGDFERVARTCYAGAIERAQWKRDRAEQTLTACETDDSARCWGERGDLREKTADLERLKRERERYDR